MATMVNIREFHKFVQSDVPKAPVEMISSAIVDTLRAFCQATYLWTRTSEWTDLLAGQAIYGFSMPEGTGMCGILHAEYRPDALTTPREVLPTTVDTLNSRCPGWRNETGLAPRSFIAKEPDVLQIIPYPAATDADQTAVFRVEIALFPSIDAVQAPEFLFANWGMVIGAGAKVRLMTMPKQPWSGDPSYFNKIYNDGVTACRSRVNKSATGSSVRVKIPTIGRR